LLVALHIALTCITTLSLDKVPIKHEKSEVLRLIHTS